MVFVPTFLRIAQNLDEMTAEEERLAFDACICYLWAREDWEYPLIDLPKRIRKQYEDEVIEAIAWFELQGHMFEPPSSDMEWYRHSNPCAEID